MAQPQGLNVPVITVTAILTVLSTAIIMEGVRTYYLYTLDNEEASKWADIKLRTVDELRAQQQRMIHFDTTIPIDSAMTRIAGSGGKLPSTQPGQM